MRPIESDNGAGTDEHGAGLDAALAMIAANGRKSALRRLRLGADRRLARLNTIAAGLGRRFADGVPGGRGVFARLASPEQQNFLRAGALIAARSHQLDGLRASAAAQLLRAARLRPPKASATEVNVMKTDQLRAVFGKLNDMAFDVARLDATAALKPGSELAVAIRDRQLLGLEENLRDDFSRVALLLGFVITAPRGRSEAGAAQFS